MFLCPCKKYELFVNYIKSLEQKEEHVLIIEGVPIIVKLVDIEYINDHRKKRPKCPD